MTFIKSIVIVLGLSLGTSLSGNAQDAFFSHFNYMGYYNYCFYTSAIPSIRGTNRTSPIS